MAKRLVLHIGVQKSGTTYIQQMMQDHVREFAEIGVLYPVPSGPRGKTLRVNHHEIATYGLLGEEYPWVTRERAIKEKGWWAALQKQVKEWPETAVISAEALSVVRLDAARRTIEAFGVPDNTDVVITGRGLGMLLPSAWQQHIRNGRSIGLASYLGRLAGERSMGWEALEKDAQSDKWRAFALGRLAERWASIVGTDRVKLITNPGSPANQLWHRFIETIDMGDVSEISAPDETTTIHSGVTAAEAEVLTSINANLLLAGWPRDDVRRLGNRIVKAFCGRESRGPRVGVPTQFREQVGTWSKEDIGDLAQCGVRIAGDLGELTYCPDTEPPEPTASDVAEAAGVAARIAAERLADSNDSSKRSK